MRTITYQNSEENSNFLYVKYGVQKKVYSTNNDEYDDNDWDKPGLINGNLPINIKRKNAIVDKY